MTVDDAKEVAARQVLTSLMAGPAEDQNTEALLEADQEQLNVETSLSTKEAQILKKYSTFSTYGPWLTNSNHDITGKKHQVNFLYYSPSNAYTYR